MTNDIDISSDTSTAPREFAIEVPDEVEDEFDVCDLGERYVKETDADTLTRNHPLLRVDDVVDGFAQMRIDGKDSDDEDDYRHVYEWACEFEQWLGDEFDYEEDRETERES